MRALQRALLARPYTHFVALSSSLVVMTFLQVELGSPRLPAHAELMRVGRTVCAWMSRRVLVGAWAQGSEDRGEG